MSVSSHLFPFHSQAHDPANLLALIGMNECAFDAQSKDFDLAEATSAAKTYRDAINTMNRAYIAYYDGPASSAEAQQRSNDHLDDVEAARNNAEEALRTAANAWLRGLMTDPLVRHTTYEAREALWDAQKIDATVRAEAEYKATRARRAADASYHNLVMSDRNARVDHGLLAVVARQPGIVVRDGLVVNPAQPAAAYIPIARQPGVVVRDGSVLTQPQPQPPAAPTPVYEVDSPSATMSISSGPTPPSRRNEGGSGSGN